jgi:hypothetical protein
MRYEINVIYIGVEAVAAPGGDAAVGRIVWAG